MKIATWKTMKTKRKNDECRIVDASLFRQRLQSSSDSFYSTILENSNRKQTEIIRSIETMSIQSFDFCSVFIQWINRTPSVILLIQQRLIKSCRRPSFSFSLAVATIRKISKRKSNSTVKMGHRSTPSRKSSNRTSSDEGIFPVIRSRSGSPPSFHRKTVSWTNKLLFIKEGIE